MYAELIDLLSDQMLEPHERDEIAERVAAAPHDPEYEWTQTYADATVACASELRSALDEFAATSDKIDEVHEQIQEMFDDFPDFPYEAVRSGWGDVVDGDKYGAWLDAELAGRGTEKGGYGFVVFDTRVDDNMSVFVVDRNDIDRIIQLAGELDLRIQRQFT
ncbi:hypothetical protein IA69_12580 [Massilia sp. JS1662]|nr:hypothetical protein [Massilia sp. JS1662]KGF81482.1 hypothetical protein IA69_12580 [Massilia sp. JS1662]